MKEDVKGKEVQEASKSGELADMGSQPDASQGVASQEASDGPQRSNGKEPVAAKPNVNRVACKVCGLFNHLTKDCRRMLCEICGLNTHTAYECRACAMEYRT